MSIILRAALAFLVIMPAAVALADDIANGEALRYEIENLRETGRLSIGEVDIATGNALAEFYERRDFSPTWTNPDQVRELLELVRASRDDGLQPEDYHAEKIELVYREMSRNTTPTPRQLAAVELLLTDGLLRLGYHQLFGRIDPASLDSRWNFDSRPIGPDPLQTLQEYAVDVPDHPGELTR